jgi:hypothetical protein
LLPGNSGGGERNISVVVLVAAIIIQINGMMLKIAPRNKTR